MGYKSHAQRKAVWASKKDGGKGNPNSPAKLKKPKGDGLKRVTESGQRQKEVLSYIDKANKQMEDYKAKTSEKKMYGGREYVIKPRGGMASPFKLKPKSPLMGKISASCKARAKKKFKVWPSAYASGWGVRCTQGKV